MVWSLVVFMETCAPLFGCDFVSCGYSYAHRSLSDVFKVLVLYGTVICLNTVWCLVQTKLVLVLVVGSSPSADEGPKLHIISEVL